MQGLSEFERVFPAGHLLFEQDEPGSRMYIIKKGQVRIFREVEHGELLLALLGPGEFFGEMALLERLPRSASARCEKNCMLIEVDAAVFLRMIAENAEIAVRMMCKLASRVRELGARVQRLYADRGSGRAIEVLGFMLPSNPVKGEPMRVTEADLRKEVHAKTGLMPWQLDTVLLDLEATGCVRLEGGEVLVDSREDLQSFSRYLELRRKYEGASEEASDTAAADGMVRLLRALDLSPSEVERNQTVLAQHYQDYLKLKSRFEGRDVDEELPGGSSAAS